MFINSTIARAVLRSPDGEPGGGGGTATSHPATALETPALDPLNPTARANFEASLDKMFAAVDAEKPLGRTTDISDQPAPEGAGLPAEGEPVEGEPAPGEGEPIEGEPASGEDEPAPEEGDAEYKTLMKRVGKLLRRNDEL